MFFDKCSYNIKLFQWAGIKLQCPCTNLMICSFKDVLKNVALDFVLLVFSLLLVYVACLWRFATIDLVFVSKILVFKIESWI